MATEILLGWTCVASRNLVDESLAVIRALQQEDLVLARQRLSRIVGRDTQSLSETEINRAVIETLAESACDGIVAPLSLYGHRRRPHGHGLQSREHTGLHDRARRPTLLLLWQGGRAAG